VLAVEGSHPVCVHELHGQVPVFHTGPSQRGLRRRAQRFRCADELEVDQVPACAGRGAGTC
jgi:hypothetical protein